MLPHLKHPTADGLDVAKLSALHFFQTARKATMRQPVIKTKQPSLESVGIFDREDNLTVTKQLHTVKLLPDSDLVSSEFVI